MLGEERHCDSKERAFILFITGVIPIRPLLIGITPVVSAITLVIMARGIRVACVALRGMKKAIPRA
ncbi:MAG: hypothetical protein WCR45_06365 [Bacteroidaceae bacterium]